MIQDQEEVEIVGARWLLHIDYQSFETVYIPSIYPAANRMILPGLMKKLWHNLQDQQEEEYFVTLHEINANGNLTLLDITKIN